MVERIVERAKEPEPEEVDIYQKWAVDHPKELIKQHARGKRVVKYGEVAWMQCRMALLKYYTSPENWDKLAAPGWHCFRQRIYKHSGKHRHQGGIIIYILDGKGYSVFNGVRYDWKKGDLLMMPIQPGGVEHQHFNLEPDKPSDWFAIIFYPFMHDFLASLVVQVEEHPDWRGMGTVRRDEK